MTTNAPPLDPGALPRAEPRTSGPAGVLGVVAIARNEGERLRRCLESLRREPVTAVYVDSGSTDGSVALARSMGVEVVELDMTRPFTAARARNAGFERLLEVEPGARFVMFLDGDCEVADGWLAKAASALETRPRGAVVFGRRRERFPERSVYNRLADVEWNMPIGAEGPDGEAGACGGDALMRVDAFREVGGYDPSVPAGEEPELCRRLRARGWKVYRLDADMTWHDSAMLRFGQWWRRQFRTGYGAYDYAVRFGGPDDPFRGLRRSSWTWAVGFPAAVLACSGLGLALAGPPGAAAGALAVPALAAAQAVRIALRNRWRTGTFGTALAYGASTLAAKWPQAAGQWLSRRDHRDGRHARLIEYKAPAPVSARPAV